MDTETQVKAIVQAWANLSAPPAGTDILRVLWANSVGGDFSLGAEDLAQRLNAAMSSDIEGSDITVSMTVDGLVNMF